MVRISRRDTFALMGAGLVAPLAFGEAPLAVKPERILPTALDQGDTVAIVACSSSYEEPGDFDAALELMSRLRLNPRFGLHSTQVNELFAGSDEQRVADLHDAMADPQVKAVMLLRGGYGAQRLLDLIDYDLIRRNPKVIIGYSDVTALIIAIQQITGLVTFHGPVATSSKSFFSETWMRHVLGDPHPLGRLGTPSGKSFELITLRGGKATGEMTGGNLTMLSTTLGTKYEVDTRGKLLMIEDIGELPYRIDRMLNQLRLAGKFDQAAGIVVGQFVDCAPKNPKDSFTWMRALQEETAHLEKPVVAGFAIGHVRDKVTIPIGIRAELDGDKRTLSLLESAVSAR